MKMLEHQLNASVVLAVCMVGMEEKEAMLVPYTYLGH
jgi:hypothetical protein